MTRRTVTIVMALAVSVMLAACGDEPREAAPPPDTPTPTPTETPTPTPADTPTPEPTPADTGPADEPGPTDEPEPDAAGTDRVLVWYARSDASGVWVEPYEHRLPEPTTAVARAAIEALIAGDADIPDLWTMFPEDTRLLGVRVDDRVLIVDLSGELRARGGGSAEEVALAEQLAYTGTQFDTVDAVRLWIDGEPVDELWGHLDWSEPLQPDPWALSPITIVEPAWGAERPQGPVTASGEANTFEANVLLRLIDPSGTVVEETFTTATSGSGERGAWEHTFDVPADSPGRWAVEAYEEDIAPGEGRPPFVTRAEFEVR